MRTTLLIVVFAAAALGACNKPGGADGPKVSIDSVLACQNAVIARGFPGATFEQVDVQPGRAPPVKGDVVVNGQRSQFTCSLDANGAVSGITVNGQPR